MLPRVTQLLATAVLLAGIVFALQGLSLLPSRIMYGRPEWIVIGAAMIAVSGVFLWRSKARG